MFYLAKLANKFYQLVLTASNHPTCRGCKAAYPYGASDKPDNTLFCSECKQLGMKDPSPPAPKSVPAIGKADMLSAEECSQIIMQGLTEYCATFPSVQVAPFSFYANYIWQGYALNGGVKGKDILQRAKEEQQVEDALFAYIHANPQIWTRVKGGQGGFKFDQAAFASSAPPPQRTLSPQEAKQAVLDGINDYIMGAPNTPIPVTQLERSVWESYVDMGGVKGKTQRQRAGAYDEMMEALHEMIRKHPDVFSKIPGFRGGILIDGTKISTL
jgi:hypothetical protein